MKTLIVMRHGEAMPPEQGQHDADRSLTEAGIMALEARLPHMIRLLETEGCNVQIWTSPAKRAHQTAKLLERALKDSHVPLEKRIEAHSCLWEQDIDEFLSLAEQRGRLVDRMKKNPATEVYRKTPECAALIDEIHPLDMQLIYKAKAWLNKSRRKTAAVHAYDLQTLSPVGNLFNKKY